VPSFLSELGPLIRAGPSRTRIEPGCVGLGPSPNSWLRAGLAGLVLIGHLYFKSIVFMYSHEVAPKLHIIALVTWPTDSCLFLHPLIMKIN
jgi:hypothetical protein